MKDYLSIGQILDLKKYDKRLVKFKDFINKTFFILKAEAIKGKDKEGFKLTIEDEECNSYIVSTYSAVVAQQIKDLLLFSTNINGEFGKAIKCTLIAEPVKNRNGQYTERLKLG